ncbi:MAG: hypothetical protein KF889_24390 [Alphaproteobacteria bacterium]|nr:hypothetical protein [Alphaproteobacteria bacterium]MCW5742598.1 hypothetical protein [Alphaproteobacteria bacterium]
MTMTKILLAAACAGLLAFSAAPGRAAGPMMPGASDRTVNGGSVQEVEYRGDRWRHRWPGHAAPRRYYHSPRYGHGQWRYRNHYVPRYGHRYWGHRPYYAPGYRSWNSYHRPHRGYSGHWRW